jgi:hypothetical protein
MARVENKNNTHRPLQLKRGKAKAWWTQNPILKCGQPGFETDTYKVKVGDGVTRWNSLPYLGDHEKGKDGKSAYEIWLDQGHEGTVDDFLEWITGDAGKSAYEIWLSFGNEGTLGDFLASLIGEKGDRGYSAYEIWIQEGHQGTVTDFLNSLVGKSAYQIWLDLGHQGTEEDFIASLKGDKGDSAFEVWKKETGHPEATIDEYFEFLVTTSWGGFDETL